MTETCLIVDFGSQYTQLIARRLRELGVFSEIVSPEKSKDFLSNEYVKAVILSGGPASVGKEDWARLPYALSEWACPILGICYGMQYIAGELGGEILSSDSREYGVETVRIDSGVLFAQSGDQKVLMSHGDSVSELPKGFVGRAWSKNGVLAAMEHPHKKLFGLQFHPEVKHSERGQEILHSFLSFSDFSFDWKPEHMYEELEAQLNSQYSEGRILCALSGGVDSTVAAVLLNKVFPGKVDCVCVDTGLLRKKELDDLRMLFERYFKFPIRIVDESKRFLKQLEGVTDPEEKRKKIGNTFIEVFQEESKTMESVRYLAQGTLYPDVIESLSAHGGPSVKIKSHHNVGGLPDILPFELVEPFRMLFKDEVRRLGEFMGLPHDFVWRHPFPGPGLAVRVLGEVNESKLAILREADFRLQQVLRESGYHEQLWQSFCVFLPVQSVGVMGDQRTYENVVAVRCVHSDDGMTAHIASLPTEVLERISTKIINEVPGVNRVVYDISSKPPSTIEWE